MNLRTVFKAQSIILLLNAIGGLFLTSTFLSSANFEVTADLITLGQFMGMTFLIISIWCWRIPEIAGDAFNALGKLFAIGGRIVDINNSLPYRYWICFRTYSLY